MPKAKPTVTDSIETLFYCLPLDELYQYATEADCVVMDYHVTGPLETVIDSILGDDPEQERVDNLLRLIALLKDAEGDPRAVIAEMALRYAMAKTVWRAEREYVKALFKKPPPQKRKKGAGQ